MESTQKSEIQKLIESITEAVDKNPENLEINSALIGLFESLVDKKILDLHVLEAKINHRSDVLWSIRIQPYIGDMKTVRSIRIVPFIPGGDPSGQGSPANPPIQQATCPHCGKPI